MFLTKILYSLSKIVPLLPSSEVIISASSIKCVNILEKEDSLKYRDSYKISNESPVGKALLGAKKGQIVEVHIEHSNEVSKYKVLDIKRAD